MKDWIAVNAALSKTLKYPKNFKRNGSQNRKYSIEFLEMQYLHLLKLKN